MTEMNHQDLWRKFVGDVISRGQTVSTVSAVFPEETSLPGPSRSKKGALAADVDSDGARAFDSVEEGGAELEETRAISDPVSLNPKPKLKKRELEEDMEWQTPGAGPSKAGGGILLQAQLQESAAPELTPSSYPPPIKRRKQKSAVRDPTLPCDRCDHPRGDGYGAYTVDGVVKTVCGACRSYHTKNKTERPPSLFGRNRNAKKEAP